MAGDYESVDRRHGGTGVEEAAVEVYIYGGGGVYGACVYGE